MVPIVLRSSVSVSAAEQSLGLESGANGHLIEPVEPEVPAATVAAHLRIRDQLLDDVDQPLDDDALFCAFRVS